MTQERKARVTARTGVVLSAALWVLIGVAAAYGSPSAAPVNTDLPTISGTPRVGEVLTANNGTWDNVPRVTDTAGFVVTRTATRSSCSHRMGRHRLGQADFGRTMRVRVTAVNADGATPARSEQTEVIASNAAPLTNTARPTITGTARVGDELTATEGMWTGNPTSFAFQWQRCNIDAVTCWMSLVLPAERMAFASPTSAFGCACRSLLERTTARARRPRTRRRSCSPRPLSRTHGRRFAS